MAGIEDNKLNKAGMAFMLCGDDDEKREPLQRIAQMAAGTERTRRAQIITGLEQVMSVTAITEIELADSACEKWIQTALLLGKSVEGRDYSILSDKGKKWVELKSISNYLNRDHGSWMPALNIDCGTLPFELYNNAGDETGWLHHLYYPDTTDENGRIIKHLKELKDGRPSTPQEKNTTTHLSPDYLIYLIFGDTEGLYPMAVISFEWDNLAPRLNEMAERKFAPVWKLRKNAADAKKEKWLQNYFVSGKGCGWCWHVPTEALVDLARVTMIGTPGRATLQAAFNAIPGKKYGNVDRMEKRWQWLASHAEGRHIDV